MANFRMYPGLFVRALRDQKGIEKGKIYQVMWCRWHLALVGVNGSFKITGKDWEPVYEQ